MSSALFTPIQINSLSEIAKSYHRRSNVPVFSDRWQHDRLAPFPSWTNRHGWACPDNHRSNRG